MRPLADPVRIDPDPFVRLVGVGGSAPKTCPIFRSDDTRIQAIIDNNITPQDLEALVSDLRESDAANWAMQQANRLIVQALDLLRNYPTTPYRNAMEEIARFAVQRRY